MWRKAFIIQVLIPSLDAFSTINTKKCTKTLLKESSTTVDVVSFTPVESEISECNPLRVLIAGAGVGGLALANSLSKHPHIECKVIERTEKFKRFGGPIQLASNAMQILKTMDEQLYNNIVEKFTVTGDKENGIKDGIRTEWYAKFDLKNPAIERKMPFTGVIERPDLQGIYLDALPKGMVENGDGVKTYTANSNGYGVKAILESGKEIEGDVLIGADGIWSAVRSTMRNEPMKGEGSGATYSGYTLFAGELAYNSTDNGEVGYKVYIGPGQYFVITDIGKGNYQWYAFLARPPNSINSEEKPDGTVPYLKNIFTGWSHEIHHILDATQEHEIEQRDLYDRPPSVLKPWTTGNVALLGDAVHAMMPNLGQGGCQAIEDAFVLVEELSALKSRDRIEAALQSYKNRRLVRSAAVQGLSRFASDIIIRGFDTPFKITYDPEFKVENFNYAGVVTRMLQPILPIFFWVQFTFLYDGWKNEGGIDIKSTIGFLAIGIPLLVVTGGALSEAGVLGAIGLEGILGTGGAEAVAGTEFAEWFETILNNIGSFFL